MPVKAHIEGPGNGLIAEVRNDLDGRKRVCVDSLIDVSGQFPIPVTTSGISGSLSGLVITALKNGSNESMLVDGSSVPVVFSYVPTAVDDVYLNEVRFVFGTNDMKWDGGTSFGGASALTNGILVEVRSEDQTIEIATVKSNEDWVRYSSQGTIWVERGANDICSGSMLLLGGSVRLVAGSGDFVRVTIRDNLISASFKYLKFMLHAMKRSVV